MSTITQWENTADGILAFSCTLKIDGVSTLAPLTCWNLKINLFVTIIFIIPLVYQLRNFYTYYHGQLFASRQRIGYLCLITTSFWALTYSTFNIVGLYKITSFFLQALFFQFSGYLITKVSKMTSKSTGILMHVSNMIIFVLLLVHTSLSIFESGEIEKKVSFCQGFLDKSYAPLKIVLLACCILFYCFCAWFLKRLLAKESDLFLHSDDKKKRDNEIFKLGITTGIIILSETAQVIFRIVHYAYYSGTTENCPLLNLNNGDFGDNIAVLAYRIFTVYLPIISLMWINWVSKHDVEPKFSDPFSEGGLEANSRFASGLIFQGNSKPSSNNKYLVSLSEI